MNDKSPKNRGFSKWVKLKTPLSHMRKTLTGRCQIRAGYFFTCGLISGNGGAGPFACLGDVTKLFLSNSISFG